MDKDTDYFERKRKPGDRYRVFDDQDPHEINTGPFYWRKREDRLRFAFLAEPKHCNSGGIVHGGLLMTFADLMMCGTATQGTDDRGVFTVSFTSDFMASGMEGELIKARAEVVRRTGQMVFVRGEIYTDDKIIMTCSSVLRRIHAY
ncbi:MAG: PaaI family thioesterase [Minwuia sp.]|uniref:PaaI family thioesterase n=1 Tax=Minwuia sp. TaxID=2493630 RepID=UPI003A85EBC3